MLRNEKVFIRSNEGAAPVCHIGDEAELKDKASNLLVHLTLT